VTGWLVLLPAAAADRIAAATCGWGYLNLAISIPHQLAGVVGVGERDRLMLPTLLGLPRGHVLNSVDVIPRSAVWHRADPLLHAAWLDCRLRDATLTTTGFRDLLTRGWVNPPADRPRLTLTHAPGAELAWAAWWLDRHQAAPTFLEVLDRPGLGWDQLRPGWPVDTLRAARVTLVGTGSIGAAAAHALAAYGVGILALVDPDRLLAHNLVRHQLTARYLGLAKVEGLAEQLGEAWPQLTVEPLAWDVVADADRMRPLFAASDLIVCAADGVAPRRVVSHLARRAGRPAVLACVLEDGEIGEVLRLRPWPTAGCLLCQRQHLTASGTLDPEPTLDVPYGQGTAHRPMTAVAGDLHLVGQLAAKAAIALLLENAGYHEQLLPGDQLVVGLRPRPGLPTPFNPSHAGALRWSPLGPPFPGCPTCQPEPTPPPSSADAADPGRSP